MTDEPPANQRAAGAAWTDGVPASQRAAAAPPLD